MFIFKKKDDIKEMYFLRKFEAVSFLSLKNEFNQRKFFIAIYDIYTRKLFK